MELDLHGLRHGEVDRLVENFVFKNQDSFPLTIVTGHSPRMKEIVNDVLDRNGFKYFEGDFSKTNMGIITVEGFK
jgi:hypothetical protein